MNYQLVQQMIQKAQIQIIILEQKKNDNRNIDDNLPMITGADEVIEVWTGKKSKVKTKDFFYIFQVRRSKKT